MKRRFYFRNGKTLDLREVVAGDSDAALEECLRETGWRKTGIVYEGSPPPTFGGGQPGKE